MLKPPSLVPYLKKGMNQLEEERKEGTKRERKGEKRGEVRGGRKRTIARWTWCDILVPISSARGQASQQHFVDLNKNAEVNESKNFKEKDGTVRCE